MLWQFREQASNTYLTLQDYLLAAHSPTVLYALFALLLAGRCGTQAIRVNTTVDDTNTTAWTWVGAWHAITPDNPCKAPDCAANPDGSRAYNHSWHDGTLLSGSFTFQGVAVYIYGIDTPRWPANITFAMSNPPISAFHYKDTGGIYIYDSLFFSADGLDGTSQHTVTWNEENNMSDNGAVGLFDYAVVTVDQAESSSSSSAQPSSSTSGARPSVNSAQPFLSASSTQPSSVTSASGPSSSLTNNTHKSKAWPIAGGVIGAFALLAILTVLYYCLRRRNHSSVLDTGIRSWRSYLRNPRTVAIEPFQLAPSSSTIPRNPKERTVHLRTSSRPSPPTSPPAAHTLDAEVEQRLRNLEAIVADQRPPAYA
ncbi:hypothetical protein C8F01DRAFT_776120 [Mycena amicta]|nr:hypothetical protein C8F01DRAFT_776120 [Mycena amicta]